MFSICWRLQISEVLEYNHSLKLKWNMLLQNSIKAVIFDCDGTLVDSEEAHFLSWRRALQNWGGTLSQEEYLLYAGTPGPAVAALFAKKLGCDCAEQLFAQKRTYFAEALRHGLPPIKATLDFLHRLIKEKKTLKVKLAVASASVKQEIFTILSFLGIDSVFDLILSGHDDLSDYVDPEGVNKPKPYVYLHAAKLLGLSPAECVVIEDSSTGVLASKNARCITVAIPNAFTKNQDLSNATLRLETLSDLTVARFFELVTQQ